MLAVLRSTGMATHKIFVNSGRKITIESDIIVTYCAFQFMLVNTT